MVKPVKKHVIEIDDEITVDLNLDAAIAEFIILKARAFDVKVPPVEPDPGSNATDDGETGVLEDYPSDQTEQELRDAIEGLPDEAAIELVAVFWVGRGDFTAAEWPDALALAKERARADVAAYLMGEPSLGDFVEEGLTQLGYTPQDYGPE